MDTNLVVQASEELVQTLQQDGGPSGRPLVSFPFSSRPVTNLEMDITNRCPMACDYCFRKDLGNFSMSEDVALDCIDWLFRASMHAKMLRVELFGGEPLCEFALIKKIVPYAKRKATQLGKRLHFGCTTNAVLITDEILEFWAKYSLGFHTSLDGIPEVQDAHRKFRNGRGTSGVVERNVKRVLQYRPWVAARATICPDTVPFLAQSVKYFDRLGYINVEICPAEGADWTPSVLRLLYSELEKVGGFIYEKFKRGEKFRIGSFDKAFKARIKPFERGAHCGAGRGMLHVSHEGEIWPCHRWKGGDLEGQWKLGSIYGPFDDRIRDGLLCFSMERDLDQACDECVAKPVCGSQCLSANLFQTQSIYKPYEPYCEALRATYVAACGVAEQLEKEENILYRKLYLENTEQYW